MRPMDAIVVPKNALGETIRYKNSENKSIFILSMLALSDNCIVWYPNYISIVKIKSYSLFETSNIFDGRKDQYSVQHSRLIIPSGVPSTQFFKDLGLRTYASLFYNTSNNNCIGIDYESVLFEGVADAICLRIIEILL